MLLNQGLLVKIKGDSSGAERAFKSAGASAAAFSAAAVAAVAAVTAQSVKMAAQLDNDLRLVATLYNGTTKDVEAMRTSVGGLAREFGIAQQQFAKANYQVVSAGFKGINKELEIMRAGAKLATVGNAELVGSTEAVAKAIKAFGLEAKDAEKAAAQLWGITRDGLITVEGLNRFLKDLPATASATGLSFEGLSATISTLTGITGSAERSMDQLRSILVKTSVMGIEGDITTRIRVLMDQTGGGDLGQLTKLLGDQTAAVGAQLLAKNIGVLESNFVKASTVLDDFKSAAELMGESTTVVAAKLREEFATAMTDLGTAILPAVNLMLKGALKTVEGIRDLYSGTAYTPEEYADLQSKYPWFGDKGGYPGYASGQGMPPWAESQQTGYWAMFANGGKGSTFPSRAGGPAGAIQVEVVNFQPGTTPGPMTAGQAWAASGVGYGGRGAIGGSIAYPSDVGSGQEYWDSRGRMDAKYGASGAGGALATDDIDAWIDSMYEVGEASEQSAFAINAANIASAGFAGLIGGALISAFGTANNAVSAFIQSMLVQFAQLGARSLIGSILPGFQSGGFTGVGHPSAIAGAVHRGEYVMPKAAVDSIGVHRLDQLSRMVQGGATYNLGGITVNGAGDPNTTARTVSRSVSAALRNAERTGVAGLHSKSSLG